MYTISLVAKKLGKIMLAFAKDFLNSQDAQYSHQRTLGDSVDLNHSQAIIPLHLPNHNAHA